MSIKPGESCDGNVPPSASSLKVNIEHPHSGHCTVLPWTTNLNKGGNFNWTGEFLGNCRYANLVKNRDFLC